MKKNLSYREKLLELAKIYKIYEIQNYIKSKKYLTSAQIEHILKKNKVPIPTEINKSIIEIHSKKISKPFSNFSLAIVDFFQLIVKQVIKYTIHVPFNNLKKIVTFCIVSFMNFCSWISKGTINILNNAYNFQVEEKKANRFVSGFILSACLVLLTISGIKVQNYFFSDKNLSVKIDEKTEVIKKEKIIQSQKKEQVKTTEKKEKIKKKAVEKSIKKEKKQVVKEFVLPDLNLKTETVLSLFEDVEYDLKKVRKNKLVKPIYFTQFPKDLIEIQSVQLKKETFIKIVLPLVVAENEKILNDRFMFKAIEGKKMTSDKEKSWLRQKFKEYKVTSGSMKELGERMDIIPVSIAIAQAAKESGWGTSRFALEGNAIFGQWTWNGKGIAPLDRSKEKNHKILRFPILRASVKAYKNNLNTHKGYKKFREKRAKLRSRKGKIKGINLIHTLDNYAQTGPEYTKIIAKMMEQNSLEDFENVRLTNSVEKKELNL